MHQLKIYIAGPMRGIEWYNFPEFDRMAIKLTQAGYAPVSPADLDRRHGFDPAVNCTTDQDWSKLPHYINITETARSCLQAVLGSDGMVLLDGWQHSNGAIAEAAIGKWIGLKWLNPTAEGFIKVDFDVAAGRVADADQAADPTPEEPAEPPESEEFSPEEPDEPAVYDEAEIHMAITEARCLAPIINEMYGTDMAPIDWVDLRQIGRMIRMLRKNGDASGGESVRDNA